MANREHDVKESSKNRQEGNRNSGNAFLSAVLGGMLGAAAALLLAPKSGKEIRSKLKNQAESWLDQKGGVASLTKEKAAEFTKSVVQQSVELVQKAKNITSKSGKSQEESGTNYLSLKDPEQKEDSSKSEIAVPVDEMEIRKKLEETEKALEDEESKIKQGQE